MPRIATPKIKPLKAGGFAFYHKGRMIRHYETFTQAADCRALYIQLETESHGRRVKAVYSLTAGGMGATLANGEKVRLNAKALGGMIPRLGTRLLPREYEPL